MENVLEKKERKKFPLFLILKKGILFIIIFTLLIGGVGTTVSYFTCKTTYTKTCEILLNVSFDEDALSSYENSSLSKQYLATVAGVIKSPENANNAKYYNGVDFKSTEVIDSGINRGAIGVNYSYSSLIFSVSYSDKDPELAEKRLKAVLVSAQKLFAENSYIAVKKVKLIETQNVYKTSSSNKFSLMSTLSFMAGLAVGVVVVFLRYALDNKIRSQEDLEELSNLMVLTTIKK